MSCLEQTSLPIDEAPAPISLSVVASVQYCIVMSGAGEPVRSTFISHRPALRTGKSSAPASPACNSLSTPNAEPNQTSCRIIVSAPADLSVRAKRSVERAQRPRIGTIGHPAAGERNVPAFLGLNGEEFHHLVVTGAVIDRELAGIHLLRQRK